MQVPPSSSNILSNQLTYLKKNKEVLSTSKLPALDGQEPGKTEVKVEKIRTNIKTFNEIFKPTHLDFQLHEEAGKYFVKIVDDKTQEVIKQIPSEEFLNMVAEAREQLGILLDKRV
jgi:flagellar protein FlaG